MNPQDLVTINQAADMVNMSAPLFRFYFKTGRTPKPVRTARPVMFNKKDLIGWSPEEKTLGRPRQ